MTQTNKVTLDLFVKIIGSGPPVLLIHGGASSHNYWQKFAPLLSGSHTVIMPDLLGMGLSPKPKDSQYLLDDFVETIEQALVRRGISGTYSILAHSTGAIVGVALAKKHPNQINKLVLSSPVFYTSPKEAKKLFGKAVAVPNILLFGPLAWVCCQVFCRTKVVPRMIARLAFRSLPRAATDDVASHTWRSYVGMRDNLIINQHALADLASLSGRVDVAFGRLDPAIQPAAVDKITQMPNVELHMLEAGHNLPFSKPESLLNLLK
jgi:cis-3-alkyl-4-acyloxetan-2-one decarboxylase